MSGLEVRTKWGWVGKVHSIFRLFEFDKQAMRYFSWFLLSLVLSLTVWGENALAERYYPSFLPKNQQMQTLPRRAARIPQSDAEEVTETKVLEDFPAVLPVNVDSGTSGHSVGEGSSTSAGNAVQRGNSTAVGGATAGGTTAGATTSGTGAGSSVGGGSVIGGSGENSTGTGGSVLNGSVLNGRTNGNGAVNGNERAAGHEAPTLEETHWSADDIPVVEVPTSKPTADSKGGARTEAAKPLDEAEQEISSEDALQDLPELPALEDESEGAEAAETTKSPEKMPETAKASEAAKMNEAADAGTAAEAMESARPLVGAEQKTPSGEMAQELPALPALEDESETAETAEAAQPAEEIQPVKETTSTKEAVAAEAVESDETPEAVDSDETSKTPEMVETAEEKAETAESAEEETVESAEKAETPEMTSTVEDETSKTEASDVETKGETSGAETSETAEEPQPAARKLTEEELERLQARIQRTLKIYRQISMATDENTPFDIMQFAVPYGSRWRVMLGCREANQWVNAVAALCWNVPMNDEALFRGKNQLILKLGGGAQRNAGQLLATLALTCVPSDYRFPAYHGDGLRVMRIPESDVVSVADLVEYDKQQCRAGSNMALLLMGLAYYLPLDAEWETSDGTRWTLEKIVKNELARKVAPDSSEITEQLFSLTYALRCVRMRRSEPLTGDFARAEIYIETFRKFAWTLQNEAGCWHPAFFSRKGAVGHDFTGMLLASGPILRWLITATDKSELDDPQLQKAVSAVEALLYLHLSQWDPATASPQEIEGVAAALHALVLYQKRCFRK